MKLFLLTIFLLLLCSSSLSNASENPTSSSIKESERAQERKRLLDKINLDRKRHGKGVIEFLSAADLSPSKQKYYDAVISSLKQTGNERYPESVKEYGRYASVIVSIEIGIDGALQKASLLKKTKSKIINEFAIEVAHAAQPYPRINPEVFDSATETVVITHSMHFNIDKKSPLSD